MTLSDVQQQGVRGTEAAVRPRAAYAMAMAALSSVAVLIANASGIATGDDGVGYRATADSLLNGEGFGYFLEDPLTVWPPVWPGLMAFVAKVTPLDTLGAAILLNAVVAFLVVLAGHRLLRELVADDRLVLLGTAVFALGPTAIGFGRLLMTDMAFALVILVWTLVLLRFRRSGSMRDLALAAVLAWLAFGLRYVGVVLIGFGGLWLLFDHRRRFLDRLRDGVVYGLVALAVPLAWMLRNHSIDGTFTGERHGSARGLVDNGFDIAATLGRFLLPGLGYGMTKVWAAVGIVALAVALWLTYRVLQARSGSNPVRELVRIAGEPAGLLAIVGVLYLTYMLYVRSTTALNQLDVRLLYPAYFPLLVLGLAIVDRLVARDRTGAWSQRAWGIAHLWALLNVLAGLVAMVAFALGHPYFSGNYESDTFQDVRDDPALQALPAGCTVYSNLPNGLYPEVEAQWSPMRTALESNDDPDPGFGLADIEATLDEQPSCLVWIEEDPVYGHLWRLEDLDERLELTELDRSDDVTVFRMDART
jgi:hypothetical protein